VGAFVFSMGAVMVRKKHRCFRSNLPENPPTLPLIPFGLSLAIVER